MNNIPFKDAILQQFFVQYSLQPIISFERGSNCAEHAVNLSNMCLYVYIFTKVQYTIHCRKQGCFQDEWSSQQKNFSRYSSLFRKCMSKVSVALSCAKCIVSLQVCYCYSTRQRLLKRMFNLDMFFCEKHSWTAWKDAAHFSENAEFAAGNCTHVCSISNIYFSRNIS